MLRRNSTKKKNKNRQSTYQWNFQRSLFLGENKRVPPLVPTMFNMYNSGKTADDLNHQLHRCGWLGILGFKRNKTVAAKQCHWSKWTKTKKNRTITCFPGQMCTYLLRHFKNGAPVCRYSSGANVLLSASLAELSSYIISLTCRLTAKPQFCLP